MDDQGAIARNGEVSAEKLAAIPANLQPVVDAQALSGFVTVIWRNGEVLQVNTLGHRDVAASEPMTRDTLFRIASMTKPITSVAALMLLEEGKLRLDDPITKWAPEFKDMKVLKAANGPLEDTYPAPRDITVEDLMTHRSGLAYGFTSLGPIGPAHEEVLGSPLWNPHMPDEWMRRLASLPLSYAPGERFHYSHATDVLGFLVGRIAGTSYRDFIMDRILKPLGMEDTDFWCPPEKKHRMAHLYRINPEGGGLQDVSFPSGDGPPAFCAGGGGLISTADDYLKFARMLLNKGEVDGVRLLKPETVELMTENRLTSEQRQIPFMGIPYWLGQGFGLGVSVIVDPEKQSWMGAGSEGSFGWPGAFGTWWQADPKENMILIYLIQNSIPLTPDTSSELATGQRLGGAALPVFQKLAYAAIAP